MTGKYGPHTEEVKAIIARLKTLRHEEVNALNSAYVATLPGARYIECVATDALFDSEQGDYWDAAKADALEAIPLRAKYYEFEATDAALNAILATLARDLIAPEWYDLLYGPWGSVMGGTSSVTLRHKYGPHTEKVEAIIARLEKLTNEEVEALNSAYVATLPGVGHIEDVVTDALFDFERGDYWDAAKADAREAIPRAAWDMQWREASEAALNAILATLARDLITPEQYDVLYGPWASVIDGTSSVTLRHSRRDQRCRPE